MIVILVVVFLLLLYVLSTIGRVGHSELQEFRKYVFAHRGVHDRFVPENSMEAFKRAKEAGYGIELDVHLLADGNLAVIHDSLLNRTTGMDGYVEDLTTDQLNKYQLGETNETIPELQKVLDFLAGETPLIVELKCFHDNYELLCNAACKMLDDYNGFYCMESFDPRCVYWLKKNRPDILRGQLTENYYKSKQSVLPWLLKFVLKNQMLNFLTRPDFVAYRYRDRKTISNYLCRKLWGIQGVTWTIQNHLEFDMAVKEGWVPIFEGFLP